MILKSGEVGDAIDIAAVEGVGLVRGFFEPEQMTGELIDSSRLASGQCGRSSQELHESELYEKLGLNSWQMVVHLGEAAVDAGFKDWEPSYFLVRATDEGHGWHPDSRSFRHFSYFGYLHGRTDFYYEQKDGKPRGLVLSAGDLLVIRQSANLDDSTSRVTHAVAQSGLRAFFMLGCEREDVSAYAVSESHTRIRSDVQTGQN